MGHIGGDDFVVITTPDRFEKICYAVIDAFDRTVPIFIAMKQGAGIHYWKDAPGR